MTGCSILERNRLFRWWVELYRAAARLYARIGRTTLWGLPTCEPPAIMRAG